MVMGLQGESDGVMGDTEGESSTSLEACRRSNSASPALDLSPQSASAPGSSPGVDTATTGSTSKVKVHWSTSNTQRLLSVVVQHTPEFKRSKVQKEVWSSIARIMREEYLLDVTGEHCYNKWKNLRRDMRQHRDNPSRNSKNTGLYDEVAQLEDVIHTGGGRCGGGSRLALESLAVPTTSQFPSQVYIPEAVQLDEDNSRPEEHITIEDESQEEPQDLSRVEEDAVEQDGEPGAAAARQYQQLLSLYLTAAYGGSTGVSPAGGGLPLAAAALLAPPLLPPQPTEDTADTPTPPSAAPAGSTAALLQQLSSPRKRKAHCRQLVRQLMDQEQAALQHAVSEHNAKMARLEEMLEVLNA